MTTIEMLAARVSELEKIIAAYQPAAPVNCDEVVKPSKEKKEKKEKKDKTSDDEKPKKKRTSGYILYSNAHRDEVKETLTEGDEKPKNTDIMRKLAENWKLLSDDERDKWNTKAKELKAEDSD